VKDADPMIEEDVKGRVVKSLDNSIDKARENPYYDTMSGLMMTDCSTRPKNIGKVSFGKEDIREEKRWSA